MRALLLSLLISTHFFGKSNAHHPPWIDQNIKMFDNCLGFKKWTAPKEVNQSLFPIICSFIETYNKTYVHHSDYRGNMKSHSPATRASQHLTGAAIDFRASTYANQDVCGKWKIYVEDTIEFFTYLDDIKISDRVGFGFYPEQNNPFIHLDMRGHAKWSRINGVYVSLNEGITWIQHQYTNHCSSELWLDVRPEILALSLSTIFL